MEGIHLWFQVEIIGRPCQQHRERLECLDSEEYCYGERKADRDDAIDREKSPRFF